ncbi:MAG: phosphopantetheine-binding protein [Anaerotruncus rubiinfantis]|jgi:D-alanine--poly(phosphoribitol) ligase subunit 2|uniref:phosphopantetheine-binding protein n=1 Tax=Anaerotruncus rubiinfantis TaxID=1720200 RepID=UPI001899CD14|nr:phosphopantetheine-binding protein [Anaerotruncus rubiinfantis]
MEEELLRLLAQVCGDDIVLYDRQVDLWEEELLDSLGLMQLLDGIEDLFNLEIYPTQVSPEMFATPQRVLELVKEKTEG